MTNKLTDDGRREKNTSTRRFLLIFLRGCKLPEQRKQLRIRIRQNTDSRMPGGSFPPLQGPSSPMKAFPGISDVWIVEGYYNMGFGVQIKRNMTVLRHQGEITLVNAVRCFPIDVLLLRTRAGHESNEGSCVETLRSAWVTKWKNRSSS